MALRKDEYIAKYGEEAWEAYAAIKSEKNRIWREQHAEERKEYKKQYREEHPETIKEARQEYENSPIGKAFKLKRNYVRIDKEKGFSTDQDIDETWIMENVFSGQRCIYCGESDWRKLGVDRLDNTKGHTPDNCVPCCGKCNVGKGRWYSPIEFQAMKFQEILGYQ